MAHEDVPQQAAGVVLLERHFRMRVDGMGKFHEFGCERIDLGDDALVDVGHETATCCVIVDRGSGPVVYTRIRDRRMTFPAVTK